MKNKNRYNVHPSEDYEPNSHKQVLKNNLQITSTQLMDNIEEQELERTEIELLELFTKERKFTAQDIRNIHELWLGDIYPFAGKYRTVTLVKDGFAFAAAERIPTLMKIFDKKYLSKHTPCQYKKLNDIAHAIGVVHVELILIHPFREGNGRTARLLADLMATQANRTPLDYSPIDQTKNQKGFEQYILAIHAGFNGNYEPIKKIFKMLLKKSTVT